EGPGPLRPVAKRSVGKPSRGGRKWAVRQLDDTGLATAELVTDSDPKEGNGGRPLLQPLVRGGQIVARESLGTARARHADALSELPAHARQLSRGYPAIPTVFHPDRD
ncbi:MAG TPA: nicotinate phosphoribosyltransferase, partial [Chloroflexota bacterium]